MPPKAEPPEKYKHAYWGKGAHGLGPSRNVWICDCGLPCQVSVGETGVPFVACPAHGLVAVPPGMTQADITAVRTYILQVEQAVAGLKSMLNAIEASAPSTFQKQLEVDGDG